jgi:hypothetical protein
VALGASNLTRGLHTVVSTARAEWGPDIELLAALGHGRSYGSPSRFIVRTLPGILESGLWRQLARQPPAPTLALVTDGGNDILYGFDARQILAWVEETVDRLQSHGAEVAITGLPHIGIEDLSPARFRFFRSILFPRCRLSFVEVSETAARVDAGIESLGARRGLRLVRLQREWYGVDPIHIRPAKWQAAWQLILCGRVSAASLHAQGTEALDLYFMRPEHQKVCGLEFGSPQEGVRLKAGGRIWLY